MFSSKQIVYLAAVLVSGISSGVLAETVPADTAMQAELAALRARLGELEARQNDTWLNERRAEEVKGLVREVLADADTRASLMADGMTAGYNKGFFLASEDGNNLLKVSGQVQFRYIFNSRDSQVAAQDNDEFGFQLRRVKLFFKGHLGSPRIVYSVGLQAHRNTQNIDLDHAYFGIKIADNMTLFAGEDKAPFLREETTSSKKQLTVERSLMNELFTAGRIQGIWLKVEANDYAKITLTVNDGVNSGEVGTTADFQNDATDIAFGARIDLRLAGQWEQMKDFSAWSGEEQAVFIGAAIHHEVVETGDGQANTPLPTTSGFNSTGTAIAVDEFTAWTIDGSIESEGVGIYAAVTGVHFNALGGVNDVDAFGLVVQGSMMIIPDKLEPFIRWEHIDPDTSHDVNLVTVGANYYLNKHNAKFTTDLVWALNSLTNVGGSSGLGLLADTAANNRNQIVLRTQFQLLF